MSNDEGMTKRENYSSFEHLSLFRHSSLGFRHFFLLPRRKHFRFALGW
jgi:hypothetical protein